MNRDECAITIAPFIQNGVVLHPRFTDGFHAQIKEQLHNIIGGLHTISEHAATCDEYRQPLKELREVCAGLQLSLMRLDPRGAKAVLALQVVCEAFSAVSGALRGLQEDLAAVRQLQAGRER